MKHKRLAAAVLAAALWLTGCGAAAQSTADTAVQTAQKDRITEQFTLEKTIRDEYGITQKLTIHVRSLCATARTLPISTRSLPPCMRQTSDSTRTARRSSRSRTSGARRFISTGTPTGTATA